MWRTLTPKTVKRRVIKKSRGLWPIQHLVAMRKNCSWAIWRTDLEESGNYKFATSKNERPHYFSPDACYDLLALAVQQQIYNKGLPGLLFAKCIKCSGHEGETKSHDLQSFTAHLLILCIRLIARIGLQEITHHRRKYRVRVWSLTRCIFPRWCMKQNLLVDLADLLVRAEDVLDWATSRSPHYLLNRSNDTDIRDVLGGLEKVLEENKLRLKTHLCMHTIILPHKA